MTQRSARTPIAAAAPHLFVGAGARAAFVAVIFLGGVIAGVVGIVLTFLLHGVQHLGYGYTGGTFLEGVRAAEPWRRILAPTLGGFLVGLGWWALRRARQVPSVTAALRADATRLPVWPTLADGALQVIVVGAGAPLGREGAPRQSAAALVQALGLRLGVSPDGLRILVACAAGAGLAAVYNVPLAGAIFTLEVLLVGRLRVLAIVPALMMSYIAYFVAAPAVDLEPMYAFPDFYVTNADLVFACVTGPVCVALGLGFTHWMTRARVNAPSPGPWLPWTIALAGLLTGLAAVWLPSIPGNGKGVLEDAFTDLGSWQAFALLLILKPLASATALRSGAIGGLLTPALALGAAWGCAVAWFCFARGIQSDPVGFALIGAVGVLAVTQRAPVFAAALGIELMRPPDVEWWLPVVISVAGSWACYLVWQRFSARVSAPPGPS